ncbi:MAG: FkbM family methyltransferase, partial [Pseudomonadota bacterium]|nr:FkbM family methyltransferase [Pseudomonadota bacterium]
LRGSAETLLRDQPKLMISAYHEPDDMWQVPLMINSINPNYRCYLAHHLQSPLDYVLYAKCIS